ncbi:hypothetical protein RYX36_015452 [Vicia faba]
MRSSQSLNREFVYDKEDSIGTTEIFGSVRYLENVKELLLKGRVKKEEDGDSTMVAHSIVLTRCKSKSTKVNYRIYPEVNSLWKNDKEVYQMSDEYKQNMYIDDDLKTCKIFTISLRCEIENVHLWRDSLRHTSHSLE